MSGARFLLLLPLALVALVAAGCGQASPAAAPRRAFYFWRTTFELTAAEREGLSRLGVERLYLRLFDVDRGPNGPTPVAEVRFPAGEPLPAGVEIVPVVFLRAALFRDLADAELPDLARRVWRETTALAVVGGFAVRELQVDCDWTEATRSAFFAFVAELRGLAHAGDAVLSATIRLHQVKYRERTGVPPVDRGMLMFYNMGGLSADGDAVSIFDATAAERYLARLGEYPLRLDAALPIWSWTVHLRGNRVVDLLQATDPIELEALPWLRAEAPGRFLVTETAFLHGELLRQGDLLKAEVTTPGMALAAARLIAPLLPGVAADRNVALFDLSERNLTRHDAQSLDELYRVLR